MAVEYTKADTVWPGKALSSRDYNKLALAFNDRLKNGVADPSWRLFWYAHSLFRGMRNPDAAGNNWAAEDEWWKFYAHIPKDSDVLWPAVGPGLPEGINVANPMGGFIYGREPDIEAEDGRLNSSGLFDGAESTTSPPVGIPLIYDGAAPTTNEDFWELAKHQRGAWNPSLDRNYKTAVALAAAQEHGKIDYSSAQYYLKGYGGFHGLPGLDSGDPVCDDGYTPNWELKFQSLVSGVADKTFGTCPDIPANAITYWEGFSAYNILKFNGTVESLPLADWLEGPYEDDAYLQRVKGQQLNQALNYFAKEFKGTTAEQVTSDIVAERAFPFQDFLTSQYPLAPSYGTVASDEITAQYKSFSKTGPSIAGSSFAVDSTTSYQINDGFCFAGFYAKDTGSFSGEYSVDVIADGDTVETFTLEAGGEYLRYYTHARPEALIEFKLASTLPSGGNVTIEVAELLHYLPGVYDAYVVLRLSSCALISSSHDKRGETFGQARTTGEDFLANGCIVNGSGSTGGVDREDEINTNPVYEAGRRMVHDNLRLAERHLLTGYEVSGGKSILYFNRYARGMDNKDLDVFRGIAAPTDAVASGDLVTGETYEAVTDDAYGVIYEGTVYANGETFTATAEKDFTISPSDPAPYAYLVPANGIRSTPLKDDPNDRFRGQTNEWQMFVNTTVYKDSDDSVYKPEAYGDVLGFLHDRCSMLSDSWRHSTATAKEIRRHVAYNIKPIMRSENPPGYRYLLGTHWTTDTYFPGWNALIQSNNTIAGDCTNAATSTECDGVKDHLESCQIYTPDYEVESVERVTDTAIKVTMTGRLRGGYTPGTIANNTTAWAAAVAGDYVPDFRTDENAVLEYLLYSQMGTHCTKFIGDIAPDAGAGSTYYSGDFNGSCLPRFYFSRHIRHVYNDKPDNFSTSDTPVFSDELLYMEFILQAICGGFMDKESTIKYTCTHESRLYDYTFPNLCQQALRQGRKYLKAVTVSKDGTTLDWPAREGVLYSVYGFDDGGDKNLIASNATPTIETSTSYDNYLAYGFGRGTSEVVDFTVTDTEGGGHTIVWSATDTDRVRYYLQGRASSSADWYYWDGSDWDADRADATDADTPVAIPSAKEKAQYRIEADYSGSKRWLEFLPGDIREDNSQGFGPFPNTNLYARIFNNLANAVNLLLRARIELPLTFEYRHSEVTYLAAEDGGTGQDFSAVAGAFDCGGDTTKVASLTLGPTTGDGFSFGGEATGSFGGSAITDPALDADATEWATGTTTDSSYQIDLGGAFIAAACSKQGAMVNSGNDNFYFISSKYTGEIRVQDQAIKYALPSSIRTQFMAAPGVLGVTTHTLVKNVIDASAGSYGTTGPAPPVNYTTQKYRRIEESIDECDIFEGGHTVDAANNPFYGDFSTGAFSHDQRSVGGTPYFAGHGNDVTSIFTPMTSKPMWIKISLIEQDYDFQD